MCNDAALEDESGVWQVRGDPTEGALLVLGRKAGLDQARLLAEYPRVAEIPFSSERKRMSTIHQGPEGFMMCLKGAPESLLPWCTRVLTDQGEESLDEDRSARKSGWAEDMAGQALRVLGLAYRRLDCRSGVDSVGRGGRTWCGWAWWA